MVESGYYRFQPGEGPSRGLLRDCTTSLMDRFTALIITRAGPGQVLCKLMEIEARFPPADVRHDGDGADN